MQPNEILRHMVESRNLSQREASVKFGRSPNYVSRMYAGRFNPQTAVLAELGNILDFDLILRDRINGTEIIIDPPKKGE